MLGEQIKNLRLSNNCPQAKLAKMLNISRQAMGHYESGYNDVPTDILKKICVIFDVTADELLEIETSEQREIILKEIEQEQ